MEASPSSASRLDSLYGAYRLGQHELSRDETEQLGSRLAAAKGHSRVHPVDYRTDLPFDALFEYAEGLDPDFLTFVEDERERIEVEDNRQQRIFTNIQLLARPGDRRCGHPDLLAEPSMRRTAARGYPRAAESALPARAASPSPSRRTCEPDR